MRPHYCRGCRLSTGRAVKLPGAWGPSVSQATVARGCPRPAPREARGQRARTASAGAAPGRGPSVPPALLRRLPLKSVVSGAQVLATPEPLITSTDPKPQRSRARPAATPTVHWARSARPGSLARPRLAVRASRDRGAATLLRQARQRDGPPRPRVAGDHLRHGHATEDLPILSQPASHRPAESDPGRRRCCGQQSAWLRKMPA